MSENTNNLQYSDSKFHIGKAVLDKVEGAIDSSTGEKTITLDSNLKVLGSLDISGATYSLCQSPEWIKVLVDSQERIIAGVRTDGSVYINKIEGLEEEDVNNLLFYTATGYILNLNTLNLSSDGQKKTSRRLGY